MEWSLKKALFLILFLSHSIGLLAQQKKVYELNGYMGVQGGESFNYNLQLKDSSGDLLSGYSFTYQTADKAVKTYLVATVNKDEKTLHIREQAIIYNHGFKSHAVICLVDALLAYNSDQGVLSGSLITKTAGNGSRTCGSGSISFIRKDQIDALFSKTETPVPKKTAVDVITGQPRSDPNEKLHAYFKQKQEEEASKPIARMEHRDTEFKKPVVAAPQKITEGKNAVYTWKSDKIIFYIWDGGDEDNDRVNIFYNGKEVLSNYTLKNQKKELILDIGGNELNIISIVAVNEGGKSPNTANITIQDGAKTYDIIAHNTVGKKAILMIKKQ